MQLADRWSRGGDGVEILVCLPDRVLKFVVGVVVLVVGKAR